MVTGLQRRKRRPIFTMMPPLIGPPTRPFRGYRNHDRYGSGHFGAARDGGGRKHLGADCIALPGDEVLSPIDGTVKRLGYAYAGEDYRLVQIAGRGQHEGVECRILYLAPVVTVDQSVSIGQVIGHAQDIGAKYEGITGHVHLEVWRAINPEDALPRLPAPHVDS